MALGFEQAGFDVLVAVELDPIHLAVHERNFPACEPVCGDVAAVSAAAISLSAAQAWTRRYPRSEFPGVDCVFGGPSCQGFSVIGARELNDPRNALVAEFARVVLQLQPRWFVLENVPGFMSPKYRGLLEGFVSTLRSGGYDVADPWRLNARDYSVPQDRKRVFVVGARTGERVPMAPPGGSRRVTVAEALGDLAWVDDPAVVRSGDRLRLDDHRLARMRSEQSDYVRRLNGDTPHPEDLSDHREWDRAEQSAISLTVHSDDVVERFGRLAPGARDEVGRLPRLDPASQSPTLRAGTGRDHGSFTSARPVHHTNPRVITVREAARLHGFPDWFGFHVTKWHGFRQVGNAVPPPLARAVARSVVRAGALAPRRREGLLSLGEAGLLTMTMTEAAARYSLDAALLPRDVRRLPAAGGITA